MKVSPSEKNSHQWIRKTDNARSYYSVVGEISVLSFLNEKAIALSRQQDKTFKDNLIITIIIPNIVEISN